MLLGAFVLGEPGTPTPREMVALACFPLGVVVGMLLGWWRELIGGGVTAASLLMFYAWMWLAGGRFPTGPYFLLFASPGLLFLALDAIQVAGARGPSRSRR
jgi:hypothetical protein